MQWRSRRNAGLPPPRPRLAGSAVHPRLTGGDERRRASARPLVPAGTAASQTTGTPSEAGGTRCRVGLRRAVVPVRRQRPARNRAHRPAARAGEPAGPFSSKRRTLSGCASKPAVWSSSPAPCFGALRGGQPRRKGMAGSSGRPSGEGFPLPTTAIDQDSHLIRTEPEHLSIMKRSGQHCTPRQCFGDAYAARCLRYPARNCIRLAARQPILRGEKCLANWHDRHQSYPTDENGDPPKFGKQKSRAEGVPRPHCNIVRSKGLLFDHAECRDAGCNMAERPRARRATRFP